MKNYIYGNSNQIDLTLYQYGMEECNSYHSFGPAVRNHYLLHYILFGRGTYNNQYTTYQLKAGQAFLITPNALTMYHADAKEPWTYIWIEFDGLKAAEYLSMAGLSQTAPIFIPFSYEKSNPVSEHLIYMMEHPKESQLNIMGHLYLFFDALIKNSSCRKINKTGNLQEFYMQAAVNFVEQNYNKNISVEDIADCCNLNRSYFGKLFKDNMSVTPQEFLMKYRLNKACDLLQGTDKLIGEIAAAVGYDNQLHFSRAFRSVYGTAPREWRNQHKTIPF